jgi:hypothetical protein
VEELPYAVLVAWVSFLSHDMGWKG